MNTRLRAVFFGNHTVGVHALDALHRAAEVLLAVAHPPDPEDGVRYDSLFQYARSLGVTEVLRAGPVDAALAERVAALRPDLVLVADYRYLLPPELLAAVAGNAVNLHPSLLPKYRGRAPLNWAILSGERELGLTAHFIDEGVDSGDIIAQQPITLSEDEDVGDALRRLYPIYEQLTTRVVEHFAAGDIPRTPQHTESVWVYPRRRPQDGLIDWTESARRIRDLVRAVARPYPGAFTSFGLRTIHIWKAAIAAQPCGSAVPGSVLSSTGGGFVVATGDGALLAREATEGVDESPVRLSAGDRLGAYAHAELGSA